MGKARDLAAVVSAAATADYVKSADAFGARITNNSDGSQGLQVRTSDNDTGQYILDLQTSSSATGTDYASKLVLEKAGNVGIGTSSPSTYNGQLVNYKDTGSGTYLGHANGSGTFPKVSAMGMGSDAVSFTHTSGGATYALSGSAQIAAIQSAASGAPTDLAFYTNASGTVTERMRINSSGQVFVNTTSPWGGSPIIHGDGTASNWGVSAATTSTNSGFGAFLGRVVDTAAPLAGWYYNNGLVGTITTNSSATAYNTSSDYRLKENVEILSGAITRVKTLKPKRFSWIVDEKDSANVDGFLAHEAQTVVPEAVTGIKDAVQVWGEHEELPDGVSVGDNKLDDDGNTIIEPQGIDQAKLVPLLTAALQEAIAKIETLETKVAALEAG
tara:strand:- start:35 stop:1192 length:1158 start_codon:yes stop_codon:yes gene_type:complete